MKKVEFEMSPKLCRFSTDLSRAVADEPERNLVWPGQRHELVPPPGDHLRDVEPRQEGDGDERAELPRVDAHHLKHLPGHRELEKHCAVQHRQEAIGHGEDQYVVPHQLEDAALPQEDDVPDAVHAATGVRVDVGVDVLGALHLG
jgi:hypothetical protein